MITHSLLYSIATTYLGVFVGASALAKIIQSADSNDHYAKWTHSRWFVAAQLGMALILLAPLPSYLQAAAGIGAAMIALGGYVVRALNKNKPCDCFGSLTPRRGVVLLGVNLMAVTAAAYLTWRSVNGWQSHMNGYVLAVAVLVIVVAGLKLKYDKYARDYFIPKYAASETPHTLNGDFCLGDEEGRGECVVADIVEPEMATVLVVVSASCEACHQVYADVCSFVSIADPRIRTVVVSNNQAAFQDDCNKPLRHVVDRQAKIAEFLKVEGTPFAVIIDDQFSLVAPPSIGRDKIRALLNTAQRLFLPQQVA